MMKHGNVAHVKKPIKAHEMQKNLHSTYSQLFKPKKSRKENLKCNFFCCVALKLFYFIEA